MRARHGGKVYFGGGGKPLVLTPAAFDHMFGTDTGKKRFVKPGMKKR